MNDPSDELRWLRSGALPPSVLARLNAALLRLDALDVMVRSPGPPVTSVQRAAALREDLREGKAFPVDGVVHFREPDRSGLQWTFEGPAPPTICFIADVFRRPLPGTWRLYGLPRSALVVGAEPAPGAQHEQPLERYREKLLAVQKLGAEDLSALRAGLTCTFAQAAIMRGMRFAWLWLVAGLFAGLVGAGAWFMAATIAPHHTIDVGGVPLAWPAIFMIFPLVFTPIAIHRAVALLRERSAPIERREGPVDRGWGGQRALFQYFTIGGEFFTSKEDVLLRDLFHHVIPDSLLRFYVTSRRRIVVGVEPLPAPDR